MATFYIDLDQPFNGDGVLCNNGITCDWTSGTWLVLYVDGGKL